MTSERDHGALRIGGRHDPTGLRPDGDGRHVVGDGVVQLARQLFALTQLDLLLLLRLVRD